MDETDVQCCCLLPSRLACLRGGAGQKTEKTTGRKTAKVDPKREKRPVSVDVELFNKSCAFPNDHHVWKVAFGQPNLSLAQQLGYEIPASGWHFWEVYSGCARLTAAVGALKLSAGPPVDVIGPLALDLTRERDCAICWQLFCEGQPAWLHLSDPCTYWTNLGRSTAKRTRAQWMAMHQEAAEHVNFTSHLMLEQRRQRRRGSREHPPRRTKP